MFQDPIATRDATFASAHVAVGGGVELRVFSWSPKGGTSAPPVLFVPGWVSVVAGWAELLRALVPGREVTYLETREKQSALLPRERMRPEQLGIEQMARDIAHVAAALALPARDLVVMGSSLGATGLLESMKHGALTPRAAFLIGPNTHFHFPWWAPLLLALPAASYDIVKYPVLWYLRAFRVDARREPEQWRRYNETLRTAEPRRLKASAMAVRHYTVWPGLETVGVPVAVAHAPTDRLHRAADMSRLVAALPHAVSVTCPSNRYMHSAEICKELTRFLERG